jgi:predicted O-methyltransferase YrrM
MTPSEVEGFISDDQGLIMQEYARKMPPEVAVEIGSYRGKSACYIASAMPSGSTLYCIDPWQNSSQIREKQYQTDENYLRFVDNVSKCGLSDKVVPIRGFSSDVSKQWDKPISFLYIDAGHEYDEVLEDIDSWLPHVKSGSPVLFDDYSPAFPGVQRAFHDRFQTFKLHDVAPYNSKDKYNVSRFLAVGFA